MSAVERVVLVHGAWGSPPMWRYVVDALGDVDAELVLADLPSANGSDATLADDVAHVCSLADDKRVVLCAHSYGGAVITEAGAALSNVAHLVYLAAFAPDAGESTYDWMMKRPFADRSPLQFFDDGSSLPAAWAEDDGRYDAEELARLRTCTVRRQAIQPAITPISCVAWRSVPSTYVIATRDTVLHPDTQREMAIRAADRILEIDADHMINLAKPVEVAEIITGVVSDL